MLRTFCAIRFSDIHYCSYCLASVSLRYDTYILCTLYAHTVKHSTVQSLNPNRLLLVSASSIYYLTLLSALLPKSLFIVACPRGHCNSSHRYGRAPLNTDLVVVVAVSIPLGGFLTIALVFRSFAPAAHYPGLSVGFSPMLSTVILRASCAFSFLQAISLPLS